MTTTVVYQGKPWAVVELARKFSFDPRTLKSRLEGGLAVEEALQAPLRRYPRGVKRQPRTAIGPAISVPACDRCGDERHLQPFAGGALSLCRQCRERAVELLRQWVDGA